MRPDLEPSFNRRIFLRYREPKEKEGKGRERKKRPKLRDNFCLRDRADISTASSVLVNNGGANAR